MAITATTHEAPHSANHLSEEALQELALDDHNLTDLELGHLSACAHCQEEVGIYRLLLQELPKAAHQSNDAELSPYFELMVLERLSRMPAIQPVKTNQKPAPVLLIAAGLLMLCMLSFKGAGIGILLGSIFHALTLPFTSVFSLVWHFPFLLLVAVFILGVAMVDRYVVHRGWVMVRRG